MREASTTQARSSRARRSRRFASWGFLVGFLVTVPATLLALVSATGEALKPYVVPGTWLLEPLTDAMADWPGLVNILVGAVANGLVYGAVATTIGTVIGASRHR